MNKTKMIILSLFLTNCGDQQLKDVKCLPIEDSVYFDCHKVLIEIKLTEDSYGVYITDKDIKNAK